MERFKDRTGRTGPATWEAGTYPDGQAEYPCRRRELVRSGGIRAVRQEEPADGLPLVPGRGHGVEPVHRAAQQPGRRECGRRWPRGPGAGRPLSGRGAVRHLRHGRERARMVLERHDPEGNGSFPAAATTTRRTASATMRSPAALRPLAQQRVPVHQGPRRRPRTRRPRPARSRSRSATSSRRRRASGHGGRRLPSPVRVRPGRPSTRDDRQRTRPRRTGRRRRCRSTRPTAASA